MEIPKLSLRPPTEWWTDADDRNLLFGIHRHGWGHYKDLREDPELGFSPAAVRLRQQQVAMQGKIKLKSALKKEKQETADEDAEPDEQGKDPMEGEQSSDPEFPTSVTLTKRLTRLIEAFSTVRPLAASTHVKRKKKRLSITKKSGKASPKVPTKGKGKKRPRDDDEKENKKTQAAGGDNGKKRSKLTKPKTTHSSKKLKTAHDVNKAPTSPVTKSS